MHIDVQSLAPWLLSYQLPLEIINDNMLQCYAIKYPPPYFSDWNGGPPSLQVLPSLYSLFQTFSSNDKLIGMTFLAKTFSSDDTLSVITPWSSPSIGAYDWLATSSYMPCAIFIVSFDFSITINDFLCGLSEYSYPTLLLCVSFNSTFCETGYSFSLIVVAVESTHGEVYPWWSTHGCLYTRWSLYTVESTGWSPYTV